MEEIIMALNFKIEPLLGHKYSTTIYGSINRLLGTNLKRYMTATYPAYGNKFKVYPKFREADEILLFGNPRTFDWKDGFSFKTNNKPDALEGSERIIHLFLKDNGYFDYKGKYQFDKRVDDVIHLKNLNV